MMQILIGGDICPIGRLTTVTKETVGGLFETIKKCFDEADYNILNLETPLLKDGETYQPYPKSGPNLQCPESTVSCLKYLGVDMVTLANNHILDYGKNGLVSTLEILNDNHIAYVGAGKNLHEASQVKLVEHNGLKIGFISCCEEEYSIATKESAGAMPLRTIDTYYAIKRLRESVDYLILITHGGIEHYQLPSPEMKKKFHFFLDAGADVIVNHHQHCYSGYEKLEGKLICYGLGNFCFDNPLKRHNKWNEGYLVRLNLQKGKEIEFDLIPYIQNDEKPGVYMMDNNLRTKFEKNVEDINGIITNENALEKEYKKFLDDTLVDYKDILTPYTNRYLRALYRRGFLPSLYPHVKLYVLRDLITCDAHRERFVDYLKRITK